jgi:hypothetical protein
MGGFSRVQNLMACSSRKEIVKIQQQDKKGGVLNGGKALKIAEDLVKLR